MHWARDAEEANRIVAGLVRATGVDEVVKVKSMATQEIGLNEALEAAGIARLGDRPGRAHRPARRRPAEPHPRAGDPPQPQPRSARSSSARWGGRASRTRRPHRRPGACWPRRPGCTCARSSSAPRSASPAPTSPSPRPGTLVVVESEGNGRMCLTLPETLITVVGHREGAADLATTSTSFLQLLPRSLDRRADEPLHLDVDRRHARRRPAGGARRAARQRPHPRARRRGRPPGAALHPLLGLPQRLPGLRAHRRPRLRLGLPRPDRRDPQPAAARAPTSETDVPAVRLDACAAPASTSARCASTSPSCSSTCAARSSTAPRRPAQPRRWR